MTDVITTNTIPPIADDVRRQLPAFVHADEQLQWINGQRVRALSGQTLANIDPVTELPLASIPRSDAADVDAAVQAAKRAFVNPEWANMSADKRGRVLNQVADVIEAHADELAMIDSANVSVPRMISGHMLEGFSETFRYFAGWPTKIFGTTVPVAADRMAYTRREPLGVVGIIWGWNGPMGQLPSKLAPALAMGNTVVLKPAETGSLSSLRLAELLAETDLPKGVVNVVTGLGSEAGEALVAHPGVAKIAFTGSSATGRHVQELAAKTLKRVTLELGGKSPTVVFADADLAKAAQVAAIGFCGHAGQACISGTRVFVQESIRDQFVEILQKVMATACTPGDPFTPGTIVGALSSQTQLDRVTSYVDSARSEGARILTGGERYGDHGYFFAPTLIDEVTPQMRVVREEIFGPVGVLSTFTDVDDAIAKANDTEYGLAASVWTTNLSTAHRMAAGIQAGLVCVNTWGEMGNGPLPFGGYKQSGVGREGGLDVIDAFTESKAVVMAL
jgi:acyl-CoA reductase-like NAD-dependent aldehyde dehydrogenase